MAYLPLAGVTVILVIGIEQLVWARSARVETPARERPRAAARTILRAAVLSGLLAWAATGSDHLWLVFGVLAVLAAIPGIVGAASLVLMRRDPSLLVRAEREMASQSEEDRAVMQRRLRAGATRSGLFVIAVAALWAVDVIAW